MLYVPVPFCFSAPCCLGCFCVRVLLFLNLHVVVWAVSAFVCCCFLIYTLLFGLFLRSCVVVS